MSDNSKIEWTNATWNPVTGCTKVSAGCDHCYAETFAERWRGTPGHYFENGFDVQLRPDKLDQPLRWKKPRLIFVNSMSDLFHDRVSDDYIAQVFAVMAMAKQHTFQVLTKRHGRMRSLLNSGHFVAKVWGEVDKRAPGVGAQAVMMWPSMPLPNVHVGVSVENQQWADIRIPALLETPAAVRWISAEPLLGSVDVTAWLDRLDWVVVGGESGPGARPMHPDWARSLRDQCVAAEVPYLFKQWGAWRPEPVYDTSGRYHVVMPDGRDRGTPWSGWGIDQPDAVTMERVGKGTAGRELDGRTWDEFPAKIPVSA